MSDEAKMPEVLVPLIKIGSRVKFKSSEMIGVLTHVMLEGEAYCVTYKVAWWAGRTRNHDWVDRQEIEPCDEESYRYIGFGHGTTPTTPLRAMQDATP